MREAVDPVDRVLAGEAGRSLTRDLLGRAVDAPDGVENPQLVARADAAVLPPVSRESGRRTLTVRGSRSDCVFLSRREPRTVSVLEACLQVVRMHPRPACDRGG